MPSSLSAAVILRQTSGTLIESRLAAGWKKKASIRSSALICVSSQIAPDPLTRPGSGKLTHLKRQQKAFFSRHPAINLQLNLLHLGTGISQRHRTDVTALLNRGWFVLPTGNRPNNQKRFLA
jgi:hypothetical protein